MDQVDQRRGLDGSVDHAVDQLLGPLQCDRAVDRQWISCWGLGGSVDWVVADSPKYDLVPAHRIFRCMALRMSPRIPIQN
jgi:hypothetical protein